MSLSVALSNAMSGLTVASRGVELVSNNVANAGTEGYARRDLQLSSMVLGGAGSGVRAVGVNRQGDVALLNDLRAATASVAADRTRLALAESLGPLLGDGVGPGGLSDRITALLGTLVEAASRPDSRTRLEAAVEATRALVRGLNEASQAIDLARTRADDEIEAGVAWLNRALAQVRDLNAGIVTLEATHQDASALKDQREVLVARISDWIPVQEQPRPHGAVALVTAGGALLLDGRPPELGFVGAGSVTAGMELGGALSPLTLDGRPVPMQAGEGPLGGGRLGALFDVRDGLAPEAQAALDAIATDLYARFADPSVTAGLAPGQPGLLTDLGGAMDPLDTVGLAGRLRLNAAVDPAAGGAAWRLRDGLAATSEGAVGDASLLAALVDVLQAARPAPGGPLAGLNRSAGGLLDETAARWASAAATLEGRLAVSGARADTLQGLHLQNGVDTDAELQKLMALEHAYGANARVLSTIDELMKQLLGI